MSTIDNAQVRDAIADALKELNEAYASGKVVSLVYAVVLCDDLIRGAPAILCKRGATHSECSSIVGQVLIELACETFTNKDGVLQRPRLIKALTAALNGVQHPGTETIPDGAVH